MDEPQLAAFLGAIHALLVRHFNEEELKTLCFRLGVEYADLPASGRDNKARELVTYLQRLDRLHDLRQAVMSARPKAIWPTAPATAPPPEPAPLLLDQADFERLVGLLAALPEFRTVAGRVDFLDDVFAGSPRRGDVLGLLNLDGNPRGVAVRVITRLVQFGQDEPGQETLGVLSNKLLSYVGSGADADFLRDLNARLHTPSVSTRDLPPWRGRESPASVQEKIIGENTLRDVRILELALIASRAVVRIVTGDGLGSGFLVAPHLIMTNHHVIGSRSAAQPCAFQFNYQLDIQLNPMPLQVARAKPNGRFYTNPDLDVTVVEVLDVPDGISPLTLARLRLQKDGRVNIIQHPGGHYKKISMQNNFVAFADTRIIHYLTSTEPGSSGAPVCNNDFLVAGIHHSGGMLREPGSDQTYLRNAGSSMIAILDDLQAHAPQIYASLTVR